MEEVNTLKVVAFTKESLERLAEVLEEAAPSLEALEDENFNPPVGAEPLEVLVLNLVGTLHDAADELE